MSAHGMSAEVIERDGGGIATTWLVTCKCMSKWVGPTYEATEDKWRQHVHGLTGTAPKAMGDKAGRWMPDDPDAQEWRRLHAGF